MLLLNFRLLPAQPAVKASEQIIVNTNRQIKNIRQGYFDCHFLWKSAFKNDTIRKSGMVHFFRDSGLTDSVEQFIVSGEFYNGAFDGTNYYHLNHKQKNITSYPAASKGGIKSILSKQAMNRVVFEPFLAGPGMPQPFDPAKYGQALLDTFTRDGGVFIRLTRTDSLPNDSKLRRTDPDLIHIRETIELALPDLGLRKRTHLVTFSDAPQYLEQHFSTIRPLPDTVTFERVFNMDSLLRQGYTIAQPTTPPPPRPSLIAAGDSLPEFTLPDLNGKAFGSASWREGLLLLDFWYKSCAPCLLAMPHLEQLHRKYGAEGVKVYGINGTDKDAADLALFLQKQEVSYPTLMDAGGALAAALRVSGYPTVILADMKTRKVVYARPGYTPELATELEQVIERHKSN